MGASAPASSARLAALLPTSRGPGYRWYGPRSAFISASAIWLEGPTLCDPPPGIDLSGVVVVSDGLLCHKISLELYTEMEKRGVAALLLVSSITCPRYGHIYAKTIGPTGEESRMSMVNIEGTQSIEGTTAAKYLRANVPLWSPPAPLPSSDTQIEIRVADPEVILRHPNRSFMSSVNQPEFRHRSPHLMPPSAEQVGHDVQQSVVDPSNTLTWLWARCVHRTLCLGAASRGAQSTGGKTVGNQRGPS